MGDVARDPRTQEPLELLRVERNRLADRLRPPWWYLPGVAIVWALFFAGPFTSRTFSSPTSVSTWAIVVPVLAVCCLLQWGLTRATGIKAGPRPLRMLRDGLFYYRPGRPAGIAIAVVSFAGLGTEDSLIRRGLLAAAIVVAALAVAAEVTAQRALLRAIRQDLRVGGGAA
jgi:membrane-associated phospholipid phosphatase